MGGCGWFVANKIPGQHSGPQSGPTAGKEHSISSSAEYQAAQAILFRDFIAFSCHCTKVCTKRKASLPLALVRDQHLLYIIT
jgi:hypothetical protein